MAHEFHHVHIKSRDPRATARWWAEMFGAELLPETEFRSMVFAPVRLGGVQINITNPPTGEATDEPQAFPHYGVEHVGVVTDDLDADLARFADQGLQIHERRPGAGGFEIAFVGAPDGVTIELMQPGDPQGSLG
jgi:catechol 2,3-dioxygenase-like lactoylglutathione lyase family enzyme